MQLRATRGRSQSGPVLPTSPRPSPWAVRSRVALPWLVSAHLSASCRQLPGTGGSSGRGGEASFVLLICLMVGTQPWSAPPSSDPAEEPSPRPQGSEGHRSHCALSLISQPTGEGAGSASVEGYHPHRLGLTLRLHDLLPLFLLCLLHQELLALGLLLGCGGRESGSRGREAREHVGLPASSDTLA